MSFLDKMLSNEKERIKTYDDFWNWFSQNAKKFTKVVKTQDDIFNGFIKEVSDKLNELGDKYYIVVGIYDDDIINLEISAEGVVKNVVFVEELVDRAPVIKGWSFTALKPALDIQDISITMDECEFTSDKIYFYSNVYPEYPDEIDITIVHEGMNDENKNTIVNGLFLYLDNYLGELDFINNIDQLTIKPAHEATQELIPIGKLNDFLKWRVKEFVEKYEDIKYDNEGETFTLLKASLEDEFTIIAMINTNALRWESKASHPWIAVLNVQYQGISETGLPNDDVLDLLNKIDDVILELLKNNDGYIYIGRRTAKNEREIYFACREFRKPSKVLQFIQDQYKGVWEMNSRIYKDKYWQTFELYDVPEH